jgi:head-tail adaptor
MTFAQPNQVSDEYGNVTTGWVDRFTVNAGVTPRLGGEAVMAARLAGTQPVTIRVRQSIDTKQISADWKATDVNSQVVYNIRTVADADMGNSSHGLYLDMMAESGVAV